MKKPAPGSPIHRLQACLFTSPGLAPQGGSRFRISSSPTSLKAFGMRCLAAALPRVRYGKDVAGIRAVMKDKADAIKPDFEAHATPESWTKEGAELASRAVYRDGELPKWRDDDGQGVFAGASWVRAGVREGRAAAEREGGEAVGGEASKVPHELAI